MGLAGELFCDCRHYLAQLPETVSALFCCEPTFVLSPLRLLTQYVDDWREWVDPKQVRLP